MNPDTLKTWSVTLTPHRSLEGPAFKILMGVVVFLNLAIAALFLKLGAWLVFPFLGLDVLLLWLAFKANTRAAQRSERIIIVGDDVKLLRQSHTSKPTVMSFNRRWLQVKLEYDEAREMVGRLFLVSRGQLTEIASFLGADERESLAKALKHAIVSPKI
jgi:uncharacterized membrane protein